MTYVVRHFLSSWRIWRCVVSKVSKRRHHKRLWAVCQPNFYLHLVGGCVLGDAILMFFFLGHLSMFRWAISIAEFARGKHVVTRLITHYLAFMKKFTLSSMDKVSDKLYLSMRGEWTWLLEVSCLHAPYAHQWSTLFWLYSVSFQSYFTAWYNGHEWSERWNVAWSTLKWRWIRWFLVC